MNPMLPTALIVDDSHIYRSALRDLLCKYGLNVIAEASSGEEAIGLVAKLSPTVAFIDLRMPGIGGLEACQRIHNAGPDVRVVLISASPRELPWETSAFWVALSKQELLEQGRLRDLVDELTRRATPATG